MILELTRQAWMRYVATGGIDGRLLREPVRLAWERAHELDANPRAMKAEQLSSIERDRLLAREADFITAAKPYMRALSVAAGIGRHAVMLSDERAVVLDVVGDEESVNGHERVPGPGALCSEEVSGANGLGTSLAMNSYVEIVGPEHFICGFHAFTCQGIPINGADGRIHGILSTSVRQLTASQQLRDMLIASAHGIEAELSMQQLERDIAEVLARPEDGEALGALRRHFEKTRALSHEAFETIASQGSRNRFDFVLSLLRAAQTLTADLRRQVRMWRALSGVEAKSSAPLVLTSVVHDLVTMLQTEAAARRVQLVFGDMMPILVSAPQDFMRTLLRRMIDAIAVARSGGAVRLDVRPVPVQAAAEVSFLALPGLHSLSPGPWSSVIRVPVASAAAVAGEPT